MQAGQPDLFGDSPAPVPVPDVIGPAAVDPAVLELAGRLPPGLRMGTCSWSYPGWKDLVFDRRATESRLAREGLSAYSRHPLLRTVSLDRAFYQPLTVNDYARYAAQAAPDFRLTVKAWRVLTDPQVEGAPNPRFLDPELAVRGLAQPMVEGLGAKLGVMLLQFPPGLVRRAPWPRAELIARIARVLAALTPHVRVAVEIRSPELLSPDWFDMIAASGAAHAPNAHPTMPPPVEQARAMQGAPFLFLRWMLRGDDRYEEASDRFAPYDRIQAPDEETRAQLAALSRAALEEGRDVWIIADNKAEGSAPLSLFELAGRIAPVV